MLLLAVIALWNVFYQRDWCRTDPKKKFDILYDAQPGAFKEASSFS